MQTARNMQIMGNRLPTFGEAELLAQTAPCEFVAEARALAAKHTVNAPTRPQDGFIRESSRQTGGRSCSIS